MKGCRVGHSGNPKKCRECNYEDSYFATGAEKDGENIYQICTKGSILAGCLRIMMVLTLILI